MPMNMINDTTGKTSLITGKRTGEGIDSGDDARRLRRLRKPLTEGQVGRTTIGLCRALGL